MASFCSPISVSGSPVQPGPPACFAHPFEALTGSQRSWPSTRGLVPEPWQPLPALLAPWAWLFRGPCTQGQKCLNVGPSWHGHSLGAGVLAVPTTRSPFSGPPRAVALRIAHSLWSPQRILAGKSWLGSELSKERQEGVAPDAC